MLQLEKHIRIFSLVGLLLTPFNITSILSHCLSNLSIPCGYENVRSNISLIEILKPCHFCPNYLLL